MKTTYYVSNDGCDRNDGLTPETAWKTIAKVNESIEGGDIVRFRCGDTFYGTVATKAGKPDAPTTYTHYGEGEKPEISQYKLIHADAWEKEAENIWKLDLTDPTKFDGNTTEINTNVGFIKASGQIYPNKCIAIDELKYTWDFYSDAQYVHVYTEKNPAELSDDIRIACCLNCFRHADWLKLDGLTVRGTGAHGICGSGTHEHITHCEFHEIGGSELIGYPRPNTRYGNGVEFWSNSTDAVVEYCKFSGIYDVAITMQGTNVQTSWTNMYFRNNIMWNNQHMFEIWSSGELPNTGFVNCRFENNLCIEAGNGWSYAVRYDKTASTHLLMYGLQCPICDITVTGNTFVNARSMTVFKSGGVVQIPKDYKIFGNTIICPEGQALSWKDQTSDEEFETYEAKLRAENTVYTHSVYELKP